MKNITKLVDIALQSVTISETDIIIIIVIKIIIQLLSSFKLKQ